MAITRRTMPLSPDDVWSVWSDGTTYADWVVGTRKIRDVDDHFPAVGSRLHYTIGHFPLRHDSHTEVLAIDEAARRLDLAIQSRPAGRVHVALAVTPTASSGCFVSIDEKPLDGPLKVVHNPLFDLVIKLRNVETLRRLERVAGSHRQSVSSAPNHSREKVGNSRFGDSGGKERGPGGGSA
jgi:hypothetical protein